MNELENLEREKFGTVPETGLAITIDPYLGINSINKIKELLKAIIKIEQSNTSDDKTWEDNLPNWFVSKTKNISREDLFKNSQLWDFGSWIDAIKQRGWKWWSYKTTKDKTVIYLETHSYPYNIDPFFYILYTVGVDFKQTEVFEIYPDSENLKVIK